MSDSISRHVPEQDLQGYRQRTLPPARLLAVDDHLAACDICRTRLASEPSQAATRSSGSHPPASSSDETSPSADIRALWAELYAPEAEHDEAG